MNLFLFYYVNAMRCNGYKKYSPDNMYYKNTNFLWLRRQAREAVAHRLEGEWINNHVAPIKVKLLDVEAAAWFE